MEAATDLHGYFQSAVVVSACAMFCSGSALPLGHCTPVWELHILILVLAPKACVAYIPPLRRGSSWLQSQATFRCGLSEPSRALAYEVLAILVKCFHYLPDDGLQRKARAGVCIDLTVCRMP